MCSVVSHYLPCKFLSPTYNIISTVHIYINVTKGKMLKPVKRTNILTLTNLDCARTVNAEENNNCVVTEDKTAGHQILERS